MLANAVAHTRIDEHIEKEASHVLAEKGLTVSDASRIMFTRTATIEAIEEARRNNLETITLDELQAVLDADD